MIRILRLDKYSALYLWALFMIYFGLTKRDTFFSGATVKLVIQENIIIGVLAVAFLIPLAAGTYDLSIGAMMSFALVISASFAQNGAMPNVAGMFVALIICAVAGAASGFFVVKLKVNSFIATLGMSQVLSALILLTSSQSITGVFTDSFTNLGAGTFLGLAHYVWYFLVLAVIVWFVLEHTPTGRYMYAAGGNPEAARLAGVKTDRLVWGSLIVSAVIAGFAGVIYSWKVGSYDESVGPGYLFPAVAAVFFGASQLKGRANLWGTVIALYSLAWGVQGLELTFITSSSWISPLFQGISLLIAVALASHRGIVRVRRRSTKPNTPAPPAAVASDDAQEHREQTV
jgi:ribose transport system permease protein